MLCPHYGKCGGCQIQHLKYEEQIDLKIKELISIFGKEPDEVIRSPKIFYYRNRMDWVIGPKYEVGLKERGKWWVYVDIYECLLQSKESDYVRNKFREFIKENRLEPWDTKNHKGFIRYLVIREGKFSKERMITIVTYKPKEKNYEVYKKLFLEFFKEIKDKVTTLYWGINPDLADVSLSKELYWLYGNRYLKEILLDNVYYILPNSFFQTNSYTAEILIKKALEFLDLRGDEQVYDLYSGIGTFSIEIAKNARKVIGIDLSRETEFLFYLNAKENNVLDKVKFIKSRVEDLTKIKADKILLDPPRAGMHPRAVKLVGKSNAELIVYVSCNPKTQKRDIDQLKKYGYEFKGYIFIDQFPHTIHKETIAILKKRNH